MSRRVCADIYLGGLYNTSELRRISLRGRAIGMSDEYRGTVGERVCLVQRS